MVVPVVAVAALALGGGVAAQRWSSGGSSAAGPEVTPSATVAQTTAVATSEAPPPSVSATPKTGTPAVDDIRPVLTECRAKVAAGDKVLKAARTGVQHWAGHVQAQTDANRAEITEAEMQGEFTRTRLAGPADQKRYADALATYRERHSSCAEVDGAGASVADTLTRCRARDRAQQPVLRTAAAAMNDWKTHLAAMQHSRTSHVEDAQGVWIKAWRAAPPTIEAYQEAAAAFDAPSC